MDRARKLAFALLIGTGVAALAAPGLAADDLIGATIESRVYMAERPTLTILSRSTVPATFTFEPSGGWNVEPATVTLDPEQESQVTVTGDGEDGATILIHVMAAEPQAGMMAGAALLSAKVYRERPFDPTALIVGSTIARVAS